MGLSSVFKKVKKAAVGITKGMTGGTLWSKGKVGDLSRAGLSAFLASKTGGGSSAFSNLLSGNGDGWANSLGMLWDTVSPYLKDAASSAMELAGAKYGYDKQLEGIEKQNASAKAIAEKTNAWNYQMAQEANYASQQNAREQMAFQDQQSSTAHQREVADLRAAGLNPILSGTGGMGAAAGSGASGAVIAPKAEQYPVRSEGDAISSAFQAMKTIADVLKTNAEKDFVKEVQTPATQAGTQQTQAQTRNLEAMNTQINESTNKITQEIKNLEANERLTQAQRAKVKQEIENIKEQFKILRREGLIKDYEYQAILKGAEFATDTKESLENWLDEVKGRKGSGNYPR